MKKLSRKNMFTASMAILFSAIAVAPSQALTLSFLGTFSTGVAGGGAGIAYIPDSTNSSIGKLYVSDGTAGSGSTIREFSFDVNNISASALLSSFTADTNQKGLHGLISGNLLMAKASETLESDRLLEVTTTGGSVSGGIDLSIDVINEPGVNSLEAKGVTRIGATGNFLVADELNNRILELDSSGVIQSQFLMSNLLGSGFVSDLEGIAYYMNNSLFVVSDSNGGAGKATVYELDISGGLSAAFFVNSTFLGDNDGSFGNIDDPEGLAIDHINNLLFVSDNSGNKVGVYQINAVPIPGALFLLGSALLGLIGVARRKQAIAA